MPAYWNGFEITGARGPAGPDGNPIGTIISYMGLTAPKDYLICDGTEYHITDYSDLAKFFTEQFGNANYFGGDGITTFSVPDMRNLFLRGYRGEADEQLSGDVGVKQGATEIPWVFFGADHYTYIGGGGYNTAGGEITPKNIDGSTPGFGAAFGAASYTTWQASAPSAYSPRPVNMAVLYCIKAVESVPAENVYSAEETRIGTWIDGKPLYRKVVLAKNGGNDVVVAENVLQVCRLYGSACQEEIIYAWPSYASNDEQIKLIHSNGKITIKSLGWNSYNLIVIAEYTKTTDE